MFHCLRASSFSQTAFPKVGGKKRQKVGGKKCAMSVASGDLGMEEPAMDDATCRLSSDSTYSSAEWSSMISAIYDPAAEKVIQKYVSPQASYMCLPSSVITCELVRAGTNLLLDIVGVANPKSATNDRP